MGLIEISKLLTMLVSIALGFIVALKGKNTKETHSFLRFVSFLILWAFVEFQLYSASDSNEFLFWSNFNFFWYFATAALFDFTAVYTQLNSRKKWRGIIYGIVLTAILIDIFIIIPSGYETFSTEIMVTYNPQNLFLSFSLKILLAIIAGGAVWLCFRYFLNSGEEQKFRAGLLLGSIAVPVILGICLEILLPALFRQPMLFSSITVFLFVNCFLAFIIIKYDFLTITVEAAVNDIVRTSQDGIILSDQYGIIRFTNSITETLLGYSKNEFEGMNFSNLIPRGTDIKSYPFMESNFFKKRKIREFKSEFLSKKGVKIPLCIRAAILTDKVNSLRGYIYTFKDIEINEKLEEKNRIFKKIFDHSFSGTFLCDHRMNIIMVNRIFCDLTGRTEEELLGKDFTLLTHPEDREREQAFIQKLFSGKVPGIQFEKRLLHKEGHFIWVIFNAAVIKDADLNVLYWIGQVQDISETKKMYKIVRNNNTFLESIIDNIPNILFIKDEQKLSFVMVNKAMEELLGHKKQDLIGKTDYDFFSKEIADNFTLKDRETLDSMEPGHIPEEIIKTAAQGVRILHTKKIPITGSGENSRYLLGVSEDITERKAAEKELKRSKEYSDLLFQLTPNAIFAVDMQKNIVSWNKKAEEITGYSSEEMVGQKCHTYSHALCIGACSLLDTGIDTPIINRESKIITKEGIKLDVLTNGALLHDEKGDVFGGIISFLDITEKKELDKKLKKFSVAVEQSGSIIVITAPDGTIEYVNRYFEKITGYTKEEVIGQNPRILKTPYHPVKYYQKLWETILRGNEWRGMFRNKRKDGSFFWEQAVITPIKDEDGKIINFMAIKEDITVQKKLQDSIHNAYGNITALNNISNHTIRNLDLGKLNVESSIQRLINNYLRNINEESERPDYIYVGLRVGENRYLSFLWHIKSIFTNQVDELGELIYNHTLENDIEFENEGDEKELIHLFPQEVKKIAEPITNCICYFGKNLTIAGINYTNKINQFMIQLLKTLGIHCNIHELLFTQLNGIKSSYTYALHSLARAAEANDELTGAHIVRVNHYSRFIAEKMHLKKHYIEEIFNSAQMHDIGKIHIHPDIINKAGELTEKEWRLMRKHPRYGAKILGDSEYFAVARNICMAHHERFDGSGYPAGLKGERIPLEARIVHLADVYDSLRSKRSYKPEFSHEKTMDIILNGDSRTMPTHFDPRILDIFKNYHLEFKKIFDTMKADRKPG